jgi:hypothetical protein
MNVEQRLVSAFRNADRVEPSADLWTRVVHSIEEDRQHRRRVIGSTAAVLATALALVLVGALSITDGRYARYVDRATLEILEVIALATVVLAFGPAIRRFGRGYAADLWPSATAMSAALLRLLDLAYYLVFAGYILLSSEFDFDRNGPFDTLGRQLGGAAERIGGLLLTMGLLHAATFIALPMVALIDNSTRAARPLPRWFVLLCVAIAVTGAPLLVPMLIGLIVGGVS